MLEAGGAVGGGVEGGVGGAEVGFEDGDAFCEGFWVLGGFGVGVVVVGAEGHGDFEGVEFLFCGFDLVFCGGCALLEVFDGGFAFGEGGGEAVDLVSEVAHFQLLRLDCGCVLR